MRYNPPSSRPSEGGRTKDKSAVIVVGRNARGSRDTRFAGRSQILSPRTARAAGYSEQIMLSTECVVMAGGERTAVV